MAADDLPRLPLEEPPVIRHGDEALVLSRRRFLAGTSALTLASILPFSLRNDGAAAPPQETDESWRGEPFDDGTYFDDGYGWAD